MVEVTIGQMEAGKKVHRLVRQLLPGVPLSGIHKMIRTGRVKQNGKKAKGEDVVRVGDVIRLYMAEEDYAQVSKPVRKFGGVSTDVEFVYEDDEIIAVNKPMGLLVHGAVGEHKDTLVNRVLAALHHQGKLQGRPFMPAPVNRLDRNTSGIVVFAKTGEAARLLTSLIASREVEKSYVAWVTGRIRKSGEIRASLARQENNRTTADVEGKESLTLYEPIVDRIETSVVKVRLISGRTHQIRAHFAHIRHPLVGDVKYGGGAPVDEGEMVHQWLHSVQMKLPDGRVFRAPLPVEFQEVLLDDGYSHADIAKIHGMFELE